MEKLVRDFISELYYLNNLLENKIFSNKDFQEEEENFADLVATQEKLKNTLYELSNTPLENENFSEHIFDLHMIMGDIKWYVWNMQENIKKVIREYRKQNNFLEDVLITKLVIKSFKFRRKKVYIKTCVQRIIRAE